MNYKLINYEGKISYFLDEFLQRQTLKWDLLRKNKEDLKKVEVKTIDFGDYSLTLQFNPCRIVSSAAKVDAASIQERKCFLCAENLPTQQEALQINPRFVVLCNPFPIFQKHLTIPNVNHIKQEIKPFFDDFVDIVTKLDNYVVFYNGPKCGASAPDHLHFQAGEKGFLAIEKDYKSIVSKAEVIENSSDLKVFKSNDYIAPFISIESRSALELTQYFEKLYNSLPIKDGEYEPMLNIVGFMIDDRIVIVVFPRKQHRPSQFFEEGDKKILISPASIDFGGVCILPREEDFNKINKETILNIFDQLTIKL